MIMNREEIERTWLAKEPEPIRRAALGMLGRMSGCADANCHACRGNREQVEEFVRTIRYGTEPRRLTNEMSAALECLDRAINDKGKRPDVHDLAVSKVRQLWPSLTTAVDFVLATYARDKQGGTPKGGRFAIADETAREHVANAMTMLDGALGALNAVPDGVAYQLVELRDVHTRLAKALAAIDAGNVRP
jgi:hypothetical protein